MKKIWILTAMQEEAQHIINLLALKPSSNLKNISFFENEEYVLALSGVGKIQASIATTVLCSRYDLKALINIGIAGSLLWNQAQIWDVFLVQRIRQHDMYLPFDGEHLSYAKWEIELSTIEIEKSDFSFHFRSGALCLTGDQFLDDQSLTQKLRAETNADVVEMEAFAFASAAREFWLLEQSYSIKAISDGANNESQLAHMDNLDFAMENSIQVLKELLKKLQNI